MRTIKSPCKQVCTVEDGVCIGCHRNLDEIEAWISLTDEQKKNILRKSVRRKKEKSMNKPLSKVVAYLATPDVPNKSGYIIPKTVLDKLVYEQPVMYGRIGFPFRLFMDNCAVEGITPDDPGNSHFITDFHYDDAGNLNGVINILDNKEGKELHRMFYRDNVGFRGAGFGQARIKGNTVYIGDDFNMVTFCAVEVKETY